MQLRQAAESMSSRTSPSKFMVPASCNAYRPSNRNYRSAPQRYDGTCGQANSDKRLGSHPVCRQRSRGSRSGCLCDDQPTGYDIYKFWKRIPQTRRRVSARMINGYPPSRPKAPCNSRHFYVFGCTGSGVRLVWPGIQCSSAFPGLRPGKG